jgi:predicted GH43/DUF377 family glycosyl hydrolase
MKNIFITILFLLITGFIHSQTEWFKYPGNPVLVPGPESWDNIDVSFGKVLFDGSEYKMWYTGAGNIFQIGYATSVDGMNWNKYSGNPVLSPGDPGSWDAGGVGIPTVIFDGSTYHMWYAGSPTNPLTQIRIGYATSTDGILWQKDTLNNPVLNIGSSGEWDDLWVTHPTVIKDGADYKMWYTGSRTVSNGMIGHAISPDGVNWTKYNDPTTPNPPNVESDPVLTGTAGWWDELTVWQACALLNNSIFEIWYAGNNGSLQRIGYATSTDGGITWEKYPTPVLTEPFAVLAPSVIFGNDQIYRMWYTSSDRRIYYAYTLPVPVELESFSAITIGNNINLTWVTATELNNHGFELFRNGNKIAFVEGNGTTTEKQEYFYADKNLMEGIYNYRLEQIDFDGSRNIISNEINVYLTLPEKFALEQNYPNPFNPTTVISYQLPVSSDVTLKVYDLLGREVATLVDEFIPAGKYEVEFDGSNLSGGTYFYRLRAGEVTASKKLILLK